jgi:pimeloyl-ACP methyl ester carboxylesterase
MHRNAAELVGRSGTLHLRRHSAAPPPGSRARRACLLLGATALILALAPASAAPAAAQHWRELHWLIPHPAARTAMRTVVLLPPGKPPFATAVINHGSSESEDFRADAELPRYETVASFFLRRGYAVVLPQRPGHGATQGTYLESSMGCADARYEEAGYGTAISIKLAVDFARGQGLINNGSRAVLVGHSAGGWGALAAAARYPQAASGVINFSGGRGGHSYGVAGRNCAPERLIAAAAAFGARAQVPTLWLYAANDTYFPPALSKRMADAFRAAGGLADYHLLPAVADEGHLLITASEAAPGWAPLVGRFLTRLR